MVDIHSGYQFATGIVGESHYQAAIKKCYNDRAALKKGDSAFIDVTLLLDDGNPYDNQAVAVMSKHGKLGHLSRAYARQYRKDYGESLTVRARIYSSTGKMFGVWVDLPYADDGYEPQATAQEPPPAKAARETILKSQPKPSKQPKPAKEPPPPPKLWKEQSASEKVGTLIACGIFFGVLYVIYRLIAFVFHLIF